jgi:hypothetical protein
MFGVVLVGASPAQIGATHCSCRTLARAHRGLDGDQEWKLKRRRRPAEMKGWIQRCEFGSHQSRESCCEFPCRLYLGWSRIRAGIEGASLPTEFVTAVEHGLPRLPTGRCSAIHKAPMNGCDMEEEIMPGYKAAYLAAYKVMYPGAAKYYGWTEIQVETKRVRELNRRKPCPKARDIQTYGSRIGNAVLAAVNHAAMFLPKRATTEGSDRDQL